MAPNPKAAGRARKEEKVEKGKQAEKAKVAAVEDEEWSKGAKGAKGKVVDKAASAAEAQARKDAARKQLEEEEANAPKAKAPPAKKTPAKAAAAPKPKPIAVPDFADGLEPAVESFGASGIDDALDLLQLVNEKTDKAATGSRAAQVVELHPERKYKAAFEAFKDDNLAQYKKDYPGLRLQQYHDKLHKDFQKSALNPFNQVTLAYDATKEDKVAALKAVREQTAQRLRDN